MPRQVWAWSASLTSPRISDYASIRPQLGVEAVGQTVNERTLLNPMIDLLIHRSATIMLQKCQQFILMADQRFCSSGAGRYIYPLRPPVVRVLRLSLLLPMDKIQDSAGKKDLPLAIRNFQPRHDRPASHLNRDVRIPRSNCGPDIGKDDAVSL